MKDFYDAGGRSEADFTGAEHLAYMREVNDIKTFFKRPSSNGEIVELHYTSKILGLDYYVILYYKLKTISIVSLRYDVKSDDIFLAIICGIIINSHGFFEKLTLNTLGNYEVSNKDRTYFLAAIYRFTYEFRFNQLDRIKKLVNSLKIAPEEKEKLYILEYLLYSNTGINYWIIIGFESRTSFDLRLNSSNIKGLKKMLKRENKEYFLSNVWF